MKKQWLSMLMIASLAIFSLTGCAAGSAAEEENESSTKDSASIDESSTEDETSSDTMEEDSTSESSGDSVDENEAVDEDDENTDAENGVEATPLDEIQGEGMTDDEIPDTSNASEANVGEVCTVADTEGNEIGTLTITSFTETDERDENNASTPENVLVVSYTYTNTSEDMILIDALSFKLIVNNAVCTPYYGAFLTTAEACESGETASAEIAFEVGQNFKKGNLVFSYGDTEASYTFKLKAQDM